MVPLPSMQQQKRVQIAVHDVIFFLHLGKGVSDCHGITDRGECGVLVVIASKVYSAVPGECPLKTACKNAPISGDIEVKRTEKRVLLSGRAPTTLP